MICFFNLQSEHDELESKFLEERAQLEAKYQKLYEPLYTKVCVLLVGYDIGPVLIALFEPIYWHTFCDTVWENL